MRDGDQSAAAARLGDARLATRREAALRRRRWWRVAADGADACAGQCTLCEQAVTAAADGDRCVARHALDRRLGWYHHIDLSLVSVSVLVVCVCL